MNRIILHIDMDAFFAAIEERDHPEYINKPLVVGADPKWGRGVVSTCNYKAREYGIHSAMPISQAYKRCPDAIFIPPRLKGYADVSQHIMKILERFSPDIEQISIDEAFLDISTAYKICGSPRDCGMQIKKAIKDETQLAASVGIAPNKFMAKIASDLEKPDGLVIVEANRVKEFLHPLDISRLWGVGKKTLPQLHKLGIFTIGDLATHSHQQLEKKFGLAGDHLYKLAHGIDDRPVESAHSRKSISKEFTFNEDVDDDLELTNMIKAICNELTHEMRRKNIKGRTVTLKIRLTGFHTFTRSKSMNHYINDFDNIFNIAQELFTQFQRNNKVRLIGVGISNLESDTPQMNLFEQPTHKNVDDVLDRVREKFGTQAITRASLINRKEQSRWIRNDD